MSTSQPPMQRTPYWSQVRNARVFAVLKGRNACGSKMRLEPSVASASGGMSTTASGMSSGVRRALPVQMEMSSFKYTQLFM